MHLWRYSIFSMFFLRNFFYFVKIETVWIHVTEVLHRANLKVNREFLILIRALVISPCFKDLTAYESKLSQWSTE